MVNSKINSSAPVFRVPLPEALNYQDWLFENHHPIQYCDVQGVWHTKILGDPSELRLFNSQNGFVFIPLPHEKILKSDKTTKDVRLISRLQEISSTSPRERLQILQSTVNKLMEMRGQKNVHELRIQTIVQGSQDAFLINKQTFLTRDFTQEDVPVVNNIKKETQVFVSRVTEHLKGYEGPRFLFDLLERISSGSTLDHVSRVFNHTLGLLLFFNERFNLKSQVGVWRTLFHSTFEPYYRRLLPQVENLSLDLIFPKITQFTEEQILDFGLGALLHDIGKVPELDYFESTEGYDREKVMQHAFSGYGILTKTYEKNRAAAIMAGTHHEYYGHPLGYGIFRSIYDPLARSRGMSPQSAMTLDLSQAELRHSLSLFPVKLLEITDIFDALTDPSRIYRDRKSHSPLEAVEILRKSFLDEDLKIDPLCFDLFCHFLLAEGYSEEIREFALTK